MPPHDVLHEPPRVAGSLGSERGLVERFLRYVAIPSQSDAGATSLPSTEGQRELAMLLADELRALGAADVVLDDRAILTARLPGTAPDAPAIGFCAHLDTVDVGLSPVIRPQRLRFEGEDLCLNPAQDIWLRVAAHPEIMPYRGQDILFGDGTSVLGADNKAAVAVLMTLAERVLAGSTADPGGVTYGDIHLAFVPDEEIGLRGAKAMPLDRFPVAFAYTVDACALGEFVWETFNAAQATIEIAGVTAHPMAAKNVLVNPILVAADLIARLDPDQTPERTEGREGYWWVNNMTANQAGARLSVSIRDFDAARFAARKQAVLDAVAATAERFPRARLTCRIDDTYGNIADALGPDRSSVDLATEAMRRLQIAPNVIAMRGGTDGSALSARGIPTPNLFTGGLNFHSRFEFLPVPSFCRSLELVDAICRLAAARTGQEDGAGSAP
ncbi:peptidase T [Rhizosaccharibacter radicis]|uniref:Peptidase T n=1 Tax=Rhizosaccharibacter radicis TaxID=2782605 RepID=A0ABT1W4D7_9PROT|nr:peptidase T [Acetobacteraceae bacterium KSS12]